MIQSGFLGRRLGPLLKTELPLMKNVIKPLAKSVLIPLGLTAAALAVDVGIHKKILGSGHLHSSSSAFPHHPSSSASHDNNNNNNNNNNNTILIISNNEMKDIKIVKSLEDSSFLPEGVSQAIQNEFEEQRGELLSMLLGTLGASLLGNIVAGEGTNRAGEEIVRTCYGSNY